METAIPGFRDYDSEKVDCKLPPIWENLQDKSVIVTGGATGLGAEYVKAFAKAGAYVTFCDIKMAEGLALHEAVRGTRFVHGDVTSWNDQMRLFEAAMCHSPQISCDIVIANAGVSSPDGKSILDDVSLPPVEPLVQHIDVNTRGILYTSKLAMHYFRRSPSDAEAVKDRCLIIIGSMASYLDQPGSSIYSMTKFASRGLMRSLRRSIWLGQTRVNLLCPWFAPTPSHSPSFTEHLLLKGIKFTDPKDAALAAMRVASDPSINGRALGVLPRDYCKEGYVDLDRDDVASGSDMEHWQQVMLKSTAGF